MMKRIAFILLSLFMYASLFASPKSESVKKQVQEFFSETAQAYVAYTDDENDDLYFIGSKDCFFYPTLNFDINYDHYVFDAKWGAEELDTFVLSEDIDIRSVSGKNGKSLMLITAEKHIVVRKSENYYLHYVYKKTL